MPSSIPEPHWGPGFPILHVIPFLSIFPLPLAATPIFSLFFSLLLKFTLTHKNPFFQAQIFMSLPFGQSNQMCISIIAYLNSDEPHSIG